MFFASVSMAQIRKNSGNVSGIQRPMPMLAQHGETMMPYSSSPTVGQSGFPSSHFSNLLSVPNADVLPISSRYDVAANGRALHSLAVDPDDPMKLHFIAMVLTDNTAADTAAPNAFSSRRVVYSYSSDGGTHWTAPKIVGNVRLGFPNIILYKRNGVNVPIIAAHNGPNSAGSTNWVTQIYIEQGNPGDGNFKLFAANRTDSVDNITKDIGYPVLALSPNQDKLYVLGCVLQASSSVQPQVLVFGSYSLDAARNATWNGWTLHPAGDASTALCASGDDQMHVASNGTIGILWAQGTSDDKGLYFVESKDGGKTWTQGYNQLYQPDQSGPGGILADYDGMDFFYDKTNRANFIWEMDYQQSSNNTFYPYTGMVCYWGMNDPTVKILSTVVTPGFTSLQMNGVVANDTVLYTPTYFTPPTAAAYEPTGVPFISKVTTALAADPKFCKVFYSTFQDNDTMTVDQLGDGSTIKTYLFRNIYFQQTTDGGATWSEPAPFRNNDPNQTDPIGKYDFHFPSTSYLNPASGNSTTFNVNFIADTFPGQQFNTGQAGWTFNTWYHQSTTLNKVNSGASSTVNILGQNYPNPVTATTTIPLSLPEGANVTIVLEDILGRTVKTIYSGIMSSGSHTISLNTASMSPGVYRYAITGGGISDSRLMTVVK